MRSWGKLNFVYGWQKNWHCSCTWSSFLREPVNHLIRLNFAKRDQTLHEAGQRLGKLKSMGYCIYKANLNGWNRNILVLLALLVQIHLFLY